MLAIFSNSIEKADMISSNLQYYWNSRGVYASVSLFDTEREFLQALENRPYERIILECTDNPANLILQIRRRCLTCKIAVLINSNDVIKEKEAALACRSLEVDIFFSRAELEEPLEMLSKQLQIL